MAGAALLLIAATPDDVVPSLQANGYYIESGSNASEQVVSEAVFNGRAAGGRLYIVVLAEEPPGGATTFADSTLDQLVDGYVLVVAPETVGYSGDGTAWTAAEMNAAVDASLGGESDDEVVDLFVGTLTQDSIPAPTGQPPADAPSGGGVSILWLAVIGVVVVGVFVYASNRGKTRREESRMAHVKDLAKQKLNEVANDILEMEDEVTTSGNSDVSAHYQRASALYSEATEANDRADSVQEMMKVSEKLDLAIWELDCAEAILDGKPLPSKPEPPVVETPTALPVPEGRGPTAPPSTPDFDRRPQRQSTGSGDMLNVLLTMMAMGSMRNRGGGFGGFGGSSGNWTGGGGGGRIRGGGHRRG